MPAPLRIGTRGSALALVQAETVRAALSAAMEGGEERETALTLIKTTGDRVLDRPLAAIGGKGLFTREIDRALVDGEIDVAVHSMKDMEPALTPGVAIAATLARSDPRDSLIGASDLSVAQLRRGARIGTSSVRRRAQLLYRRPDLEILPLRGNVDTRLKKIEQGDFDAIVLSKAGLDRLERASAIGHIFDPTEMLPAATQGVIAVVVRADDAQTLTLAARVSHLATFQAATAERALLAHIGGDCGTPIGAHATISGQRLILEGALFTLDGSDMVRAKIDGAPKDAEDIGATLAGRLKSRASAALRATLKT